ncbi:unnamed protein product [Symbiodinium natans]|uniref:Rab-GAP TBC domain-containing protein n=1 Tax=Symbiodinium natans TaxID=878477 RepID=A0A812KY78_9DINO|nr:unnamed protein product [Symbiodinium natans]
MPAVPGRFSTSKKSPPWTGDQQINPGWLGPRGCQHYSDRWMHHFSGPTDIPFSDFVLKACDSLDADVLAQIECACAFDLLPHRKADRPADAVLLALPTWVPSFGDTTGRSRLSSVLRAFACWKPEVGYQPVLALLAAHIMSVAGNQRVTFQALVAVYRRYRLQDYFQGAGTQEAIRLDAAKVWNAACVQFPDLADAFVRFNQTELFHSTVSWLLSTLLTQTCQPGAQAFECHVRLLDCFLLPAGDYDREDPRAQLRRLVLHIMARHQNDFLQCGCEDELTAAAKDIQQFVRVDDVLIQMLNGQQEMTEMPDGMLWAAIMAGVGAALTNDMSTALGLGAHVALTCGSAAGFAYGALKAAVLTNRAWFLHGHDSEDSSDSYQDV